MISPWKNKPYPNNLSLVSLSRCSLKPPIMKNTCFRGPIHFIEQICDRDAGD
uniref:Uncharacterized protein n=1 Tax=Picea glauca TaxID=3330 RepID=A0A101LYL1_PICGL|nr:hypothetical protein ABT39_MTgene5933 [Picea glauca]QHR92028.1 hypothetical protein Q903MT_gene6064 [Picea sitchensis]